MSQDFILKHRTGPSPSKINPNAQYWRFIWYRVSDGTTWETTVATDMRNFRYWKDLLGSQIPYGVYQGLKTTDRGTNHVAGVVTADSRPQRTDIIADSETTREWITQIDAVHRQQRTPNTFHSLFQE
jgi:hypothetical protein